MWAMKIMKYFLIIALSVIASTISARQVVAIGAQAPGDSAVVYLALGDSFTSGEGEVDDKYYIAGTNTQTAKCHSSLRSYPYLVAKTQGYLSVARNVACSGAMIEDIHGLSAYLGQKDRLRLAGLGWSDIVARQQRAIISFTPGEARQIDFIYAYQPSIVSVSIGGNDVGFFDKLRSCLMPGECEWAQGDYLTQIGREIRRLFDKLIMLFSDIRDISSRDTLYVVGYPQIINPDGVFCDPVLNNLLTVGERTLIYRGIEYINDVIDAASRWAGLPYVSIEDAFQGHRLCDISPSAMNGLVSGDDAQIAVGGITLNLGNESFHPTPTGHELIAARIGQSIDISSPKSGAAGGDLSIKSPLPSAYWRDDGRKLPALVRESIQINELIIGGNMMRIIIGPGGFLDNSIVSAFIHSDSTYLGTARAQSDGSVVIETVIPKGMSTGFHTIHVLGLTPDEEEVDYYQTVNYQDTGQKANIDLSESSSTAQLQGASPTPEADDEGVLAATLNQNRVISFNEPELRGNNEGHWWILTVTGVLVITFGIVLLRRRPP